uniref:Pantetheinase-like n=1 Tax=Hirondellea gigas TaxID=1518452 RepID=A0A6A7G4V3_9CRUS
MQYHCFVLAVYTLVICILTTQSHTIPHKPSHIWNASGKPSVSSKTAALEEFCFMKEPVTYTGAIGEFEPLIRAFSPAENILRENVKRITIIAAEAKLLGTDIIAFSEYALPGLGIFLGDRSHFDSLSVPVPDPADGVAPCDKETGSAEYSPLKELSCAARQLEMYMVVGVAETSDCEDVPPPDCPADGVIYYNTMVVFNRSGTVVAMYRKQHPFLEPGVEIGHQNDSAALFISDFGVTFSMHNCFDILFAHPSYANVKKNLSRDVIFSTAWGNQSPFAFAPNIQSSWSRSLSTNMLAANYHLPEAGHVGSGIYRGFSEEQKIAYTFDAKSGDVLIVSPITTCAPPDLQQYTPNVLLTEATVIKYHNNHAAIRTTSVSQQDLSQFNEVALPPTQPEETNNVHVCYATLCCRLKYQRTEGDNLVYKLITYSGMIRNGDQLMYYEYCGIVTCYTDNWKTCVMFPETVGEVNTHEYDNLGSNNFENTAEFGPYTLEGTFSCNSTYPVAMTREFEILPNAEFYFNQGSDVSVLRVDKPVPKLMTSHIFGRIFYADGK